MNAIYAFQMKPDNIAQIKTLAKKNRHDFLIKSVSLLGFNETIRYDRNEECLEITLPDGVCTDFPICFKIEVE